MLSVAKTAVERDFSDALVSLRQASLCLLNPQSADAAKRCIPGALAKCPQEVPAAQTSDPRQFYQGDRSCEIRVNVVLNPTQVRDSQAATRYLTIRTVPARETRQMGHSLQSPTFGKQIENVIQSRRLAAQFDKAAPQRFIAGSNEGPSELWRESPEHRTVQERN
jgi:hypothetical protein